MQTHDNSSTAKLNRLRAGVLGANDGIVSIAGLVLGVAGANSEKNIIFAAGIAGVVAGAISMAAGEYVSVSSQRDTERSIIAREKFELEKQPRTEQNELTQIYIKKGLSPTTAALVSRELTQKDAWAAHLDAELAIDPHHLVSPWQASFASAGAFFAGAILPMLAIMLPPANIRIVVTFVSTLVALIITGALSAKFGKAPVGHAILRVSAGGALAMAVTYGIGHIVGAANL